MKRMLWLVLVFCLVLAQLVAAQDAPAVKTVTLDVTDQPVADVAAEITKQTGIQVGVVLPCDAKVTLKLDGAKPEEAVKAFAEAFNASWLRAYVLEKQPPATPFTANQLLAGLENQRSNWFDSFTEEEQRAMFEQWRAARGDRENPAPPMPGAGTSTLGRGFGGRGGQGGPGGQGGAGAPAGGGAEAQPAQAGQQPAQPGQPGQQPGGQQGQRRGMMFDPIRQLIIPLRADTVTLTLDNQDLAQSLFDFTTCSGFILAASADLTGAVSLQAEQKPVDEVLTKIATAVGGQYRPLYLLALPRELSEAEMEQRMEQMFQSRWAKYWAKSPEDRAKDIQQQVERIGRMAERMQQGGQNGRGAGRMQRFMPRMLNRLGKYSAGLTPAQRMEIKPLLRAIGAAINGQQQQ